MKKNLKFLFIALFIIYSYNLVLAGKTETIENMNKSVTKQITNQEQENEEFNNQTNNTKQVIDEKLPQEQEEVKESDYPPPQISDIFSPTQEQKKQEEEKEAKEVTLADYNNILKEFIEIYNSNASITNKETIIDELNTCFENLCKNITPKLLAIVKEKHKAIVDDLKKEKIDFSNINSNLYDFSYIITQKKENLEYTYITLKNISLAGYTLGEKFKNKGEHIPNISNVEFLTQNDNENIYGKYLILSNKKELYWIYLKLEGNLRNKIIEYVNNSLSKYNNKKLFATRIQGWDLFLEKDTTTTYYKGFISKKRLKTDNHYGIEENNLKIDIGNIYPVYSYPFATRNEHDGFEGTNLRLVDKFETIDEYKKPLVDFLNKYKIGKKINVTDEIKYLGEQIINGNKMHKFKISRNFKQLIYDIEHDTRDFEKKYQIVERTYVFYIYTDLQTKIIKIFETVNFGDYNYMIYDNAVLDVYGIKTYYGIQGVGQNITVKNNKTTKITRIMFSDIWLFNECSSIRNRGNLHDDIITSFSKLEVKESDKMR